MKSAAAPAAPATHRATVAQLVVAAVAEWKSEWHLLKLLDFMCDLCETSAINVFCTVLKPVDSNEFRMAPATSQESLLPALTNRSSKLEASMVSSKSKFGFGGLQRSKTSTSLLTKSEPASDRKELTAEAIEKELLSLQQRIVNLTAGDLVQLVCKLIRQLDRPGMAKLRTMLLQKVRQRTSIQTLPDRLLLGIFSKLSTADLRACCRVCRRWNFAVNNSDLWLRKCEQLAASSGLRSFYQQRRRRIQNKSDYERIYADMEKLHMDTRRAAEQLARSQRDRAALQEALDEAQWKQRNERASSVLTQPSNQISNQQEVVPEGTATERNYDRFFDEFGQFQLPEALVDRRPLMQTLIGLKRSFLHSQDVAIDAHRVLNPASTYSSLHNPDVRDVSCCRVFGGHMQAVLCCDADRRRLVTGSSDNTVRIWDRLSGVTVHKLCGHSGPVTSVAVSDDLLCSSSWDCTVQFWNLVKFTRVASVKQHCDVVTRVRIVPAGRGAYESVLSAGYDGVLLSRNLRTLTPQTRIDFGLQERSALDSQHRFSPHGIIEMFVRNSQPFVAFTAHANCTVRMSDLRVGTPTAQFTVFDRQMSIVPRKQITTSRSSGWQTLNVSGRNPSSAVQDSIALRSVVPHADRSHLFYALTGTHVLLYDERSSRCPISTFRLARCVDDVQATTIAALPHQHVLVAFSDGMVVEYDSMNMIPVRSLTGHKGPVRHLSAVKSCLFTASDDYQARIWQLAKDSHGNEHSSDSHLLSNRSAFAVSSFYAALQKVRLDEL